MRWKRGHFAPSDFFLIVAPGETVPAGIHAHHSDASLDRTNQRAEVAAHTRLFDDFRDWLSRYSARPEPYSVGVDQPYRLMGPIFTGDVTKVASDTSIIIDARDSFVVQIEIFPFLYSARPLVRATNRPKEFPLTSR